MATAPIPFTHASMTEEATIDSLSAHASMTEEATKAIATSLSLFCQKWLRVLVHEWHSQAAVQTVVLHP
jgi:hypothetical protein